MNEKARVWRSEHADLVRIGNAKWRESNCEKVSALNKRWKQNNKERVRELNGLRRAIKRSVPTEDVDAIEIFKRDKWHCKACGCETPKELRGTRKPNAPELDHIIPLYLHGPHTKANLQCLCRACNSKKGAKFEGQLVFI